MVDLDSAPDLLQWDRHTLLLRAARVGEQLAQPVPIWHEQVPLAAITAVQSGARVILELPPELQGIGVAACTLAAELTPLQPTLWLPDWPAPAASGPVVWLSALPSSSAAAMPSRSAAFVALLLDINSHVRFTDHPVITLARLLALLAGFVPPAATRLLTSSLAMPVFPADCTLDIPAARNPAKQLAVRLNDRIPLFWGAGILAGIAADWFTRRLWYADSMAFSASPLQLARLYSLARLPRYWPNVAALVRLRDVNTDASSLDDVTQSLFARRRFPVLDVPTPPGLSALEACFYLLALGEWTALYTAALAETDPLERTPLTILFGNEGPIS